MKQCNDCRETKPLDDFYKEKRVADGRQAICKECMRIRKRLQRQINPGLDHEYYLKNKERLLTQKKLRYATDDKVRTAYQARMREYYVENREAIKASVKVYAQANKEKLAASSKIYRSIPENRERSNAASRKYRANPANKKALAHRAMRYYSRKYEAPGFATKAQLQARWDYYGGRCWICTDEAKEMDHVKPLSKGGTNWPANLKPICRPCNARKSNIWPYNPLKGVTNGY